MFPQSLTLVLLASLLFRYHKMSMTDRVSSSSLRQVIHQLIHSSGMDAYIVSPHRSWILGSWASSHMTCVKDKFISLHLFKKFPYVNVVNDTHSCTWWWGSSCYSIFESNKCVICSKIFCKLSISQFTKQNNCSEHFSLLIVSFSTWQLRGGLVQVVRWGMYYLDDSISPTRLVVGHLDLYCCTGVWVIHYCRNFGQSFLLSLPSLL